MPFANHENIITSMKKHYPLVVRNQKLLWQGEEKLY